MLKTKKKNNHTLFIVVALSFSLFNFLIFFLYINVDTVAATFREVPEYIKGEPFYWYKEAFNNVFKGEVELYKGAFGHTMIAMLINVIIFPIALITAYAFYKRVYGEKIFRVIFYLPSIIAITTLTMSFRELFLLINHKGMVQMGPITMLLRKFGVNDIPLDIQTEGSFGYKNIWPMIIFFGVFTGLGTNVVLMCGAMMRIPTDVTESLRIDGCSFFRELFSVSIPLIMPTITTWLIMVVTSVFGFSMTPMLLAGLTPNDALSPSMGRINTIPLIIYNITCQKNGAQTMVEAQALGVIFSIIIMPIVLLTRFICEKLTPDISY